MNTRVLFASACIFAQIFVVIAQTSVPWTLTTAFDGRIPNVAVPTQDIRQYFCSQAQTTIVTGGFPPITQTQLDRARDILVEMCLTSPTFQRVLQTRIPSEQSRSFVQYTLDGSGQFGSAAQTNGVAGIDMSPSSNQGLTTTEMFMRDNFVSIIAHETSHVSGLPLHDVPLYLNVAQTMVEMNVAQTASVTPDSVSPVTQEECRATGILRYLRREGPRCARLRAGV